MVKQSQPRAPTGGVRLGGRTYKAGDFIPLRYARQLPTGEVQHDPAVGIPEAPPNFGRPPIPHVLTFQGIISTVAQVYRNPDAAMRHSRENAIIMRQDCSVMGPLEARKLGTALLNWHIEPEDQKSPLQKKLADDLTAIIKEIPYFQRYRFTLQDALWFGRYGIEHCYGFDYRTGKKRTIITKWIPIHGDKLVFRYDDGSGKHDPDQIGVRMIQYKVKDTIAGDRKLEATEAGMAYFFEEWERQQIAIHTHMVEDAAFEDPLSAGSIHGLGIRSRIYWTWFQMTETLAMLMDFLQRSGQGIWIYYYPDGNDTARKRVEEAAKRQTNDNVVIMPRTPGDPTSDAFGIDRVEVSPSGAEALRQIINDLFWRRVVRYILGQTLSSEAEATGLGSGVADLQKGILQAIIKFDAGNLEETLTRQLLLPLKNMNFPESRNISMRFAIDTESDDAERKLASVQAAWNMGARIKESDVLDEIGFSAPTEDDVVLQNPTIAQQRRLWEQSHSQVQGSGPMGGDGQPPEGGAPPEGAPPGGPPEGGQPGDQPPADPGQMSADDLFGPLANPTVADQKVAYGRDGKPVRYASVDEGGGFELPDEPKPPKMPPIPKGGQSGQGGVSAPTPAPSTPKQPKIDTSHIDVRGRGDDGEDMEPSAPKPARPPAPSAEGLPAATGPTAPKPNYPPRVDPTTGTSQPQEHPNAEHRPGETKPGKTGELKMNEGHHWEMADKDKTGQEPVAKPWHDPKALKTRQMTATKNVGRIDTKIGGLMRAFQSSPDFHKGGDFWTKELHPEAHRQGYSWLEQHVGQQAGGGIVKDLGNGRLGFSSDAGAVVLDKGGKATYTVNTRLMHAGTQLPGKQPPPLPQQQPAPTANPTSTAPAAEPQPSDVTPVGGPQEIPSRANGQQGLAGPAAVSAVNQPVPATRELYDVDDQLRATAKAFDSAETHEARKAASDKFVELHKRRAEVENKLGMGETPAVREEPAAQEQEAFAPPADSPEQSAFRQGAETTMTAKPPRSLKAWKAADKAEAAGTDWREIRSKFFGDNDEAYDQWRSGQTDAQWMAEHKPAAAPPPLPQQAPPAAGNVALPSATPPPLPSPAQQPPPLPGAATAEPHTMNRKAFREAGFNPAMHKKHIVDALSQGKSVPADVLIDYPEILKNLDKIRPAVKTPEQRGETAAVAQARGLKTTIPEGEAAETIDVDALKETAGDAKKRLNRAVNKHAALVREGGDPAAVKAWAKKVKELRTQHRDANQSYREAAKEVQAQEKAAREKNAVSGPKKPNAVGGGFSEEETAKLAALGLSEEDIASINPAGKKSFTPAAKPVPSPHELRLKQIEGREGLPTKIAKAGLEATEAIQAIIRKAIDAGHIETPEELKGVLANAKKIIGRTGKTAPSLDEQLEALQTALRRRANRSSNDSRPESQIFDEAAEEYAVDPWELADAAKEIVRERSQEVSEWAAAYKEAVRATGLNARKADHESMDASQIDDTIGRELAKNYPGLGWGAPSEEEDSGAGTDKTDYSAKLLDFIKAGPPQMPRATDEDIIREAAKEISRHIGGGKRQKPREPGEEERAARHSTNPTEREGMESIPFAKRERAIRYSFEEAKHPRGKPENAGEFTEKPSGAKKPTDKGKKKGGFTHDPAKPPQTDTPAFKAWFGDSKVVDAEGKPLVVYHGTSGGDFTAFDPGKSKTDQSQTAGPGIYLSDTPEVANSFAGHMGLSPSGHRVYPAFLKLEHPFDFDKPLAPEQVDQLIDNSGADAETSAKLKTLISTGWISDESQRFAAWSVYGRLSNAVGRTSATNAVKTSGFDGIIHGASNQFGSVGLKAKPYNNVTHGRVYVVFHPTQIKSATGNKGTFDQQDARIDYAKHKPGKGQGAIAWDEEEHPRGQPDNAGEFAPKGEGAKPSEENPKETRATIVDTSGEKGIIKAEAEIINQTGAKMDAKKDAYGNELTSRLTFSFLLAPGGKNVGKWVGGDRPNIGGTGSEPIRGTTTGTVNVKIRDTDNYDVNTKAATVEIFVPHLLTSELGGLRSQYPELYEQACGALLEKVPGAEFVVSK